MSDNIFALDDWNKVIDDEDDAYNFSGDHLYNSYTESPLCVPQDSLDEIEFYPNFANDSICMSGLDDFFPEMPVFAEAFHQPDNTEQHKARVILRKRVVLRDCGNGGIANKKKQRGKREGRRGAWSINDVSFSTENEEPNLRRRKCSHCETTETPQWRIGPLGPKTLCNACGVRYKAGRLLPEYRPAASPTFDSQKHSNFHRKILKKKGMIS